MHGGNRTHMDSIDYTHKKLARHHTSSDLSPSMDAIDEAEGSEFGGEEAIEKSWDADHAQGDRGEGVNPHDDDGDGDGDRDKYDSNVTGSEDGEGNGSYETPLQRGYYVHYYTGEQFVERERQLLLKEKKDSVDTFEDPSDIDYGDVAAGSNSNSAGGTQSTVAGGVAPPWRVDIPFAFSQEDDENYENNDDEAYVEASLDVVDDEFDEYDEGEGEADEDMGSEEYMASSSYPSDNGGTGARVDIVTGDSDREGGTAKTIEGNSAVYIEALTAILNPAKEMGEGGGLGLGLGLVVESSSASVARDSTISVGNDRDGLLEEAGAEDDHEDAVS
jgi:hypothetical protein